MKRTAWLYWIAVAVLAVLISPALRAQPADASSVLSQAAVAMGANELRTIHYAGQGTGASFGQAYSPGMAWPKLNYSRYQRQIDYANAFIQENSTRSRAEPKGGGAVPQTGEAAAGAAANATHAWTLAGQNAVARQGARAGLLHELWITPHGVIKAAQGTPATLAYRNVGDRRLAAVSFAMPGVMRATVIFSPDFLVERVESVMPDAVLGDIPGVITYSDYRDHGGVKFPARVEQTLGGHMTLSMTITDVQPNAPVNSAVPENVAAATERVTTDKVAEGVWFIAGGSHNSVAIEMADHLVLVESPLGDSRMGPVFEAVKALVPGKSVRYVINSHNHFDHSGGLRAAVAEGATIVTQSRSKGYFEKALAHPNRIAPDRMEKSGRKAKILGVGDKRIMKDAMRTLEIHRIRDTVHGEAMLMVYLPQEKLLIEADVFTPGPAGAPAPATPNPLHVDLMRNIEQLKLQVERILPLHGRVVPVSELHRMIGKS